MTLQLIRGRLQPAPAVAELGNGGNDVIQRPGSLAPGVDAEPVAGLMAQFKLRQRQAIAIEKVSLDGPAVSRLGPRQELRPAHRSGTDAGRGQGPGGRR